MRKKNVRMNPSKGALLTIKQKIAKRRARHDYDKKEFIAEIRDLLQHQKVQSMKQFIQHSDVNCFEHCMKVAYYNYKVCKKLGLDKRSAARGGMLHDFFLYDWHQRKVRLDNTLHGFSHPYTALRNANHYFRLNAKEQDIIEKHMFPLTPRFPKYPESVVIILTDKFVSTGEVFDRFFKKKRSA